MLPCTKPTSSVLAAFYLLLQQLLLVLTTTITTTTTTGITSTTSSSSRRAIKVLPVLLQGSRPLRMLLGQPAAKQQGRWSW
jgi:hypothetical protein